jgi:predicted dinucleotide-binding enzyme
MTTIGFIGSGNIGGTLAQLFAHAGYDVALSNSRGPETQADKVAEIGDHARADTAAEAGEAGEFVVVSVRSSPSTRSP